MLTEAELAERLKIIPSIWLSLEERMCLLKYAGMGDGQPIIEIGTAWGGSACILILGSIKQKAFVSSIDPMKPPLCQVDGYDITADKVKEIVRRTVGEESHRWQLITRTSEEAYDTSYRVTPWLRYALVFIDGNHDYAFVRQDVDLWLPLLIKGGYLILHDSIPVLGEPTPSQLGPTQVAQELSHDPRVKLIETAYSMTVWEVQ